jgi:hypothetical protein
MFTMKDIAINLTQVDRRSRYNAIRRINTILFELSSTRKKFGDRRKFEFKLKQACKPRLKRRIKKKIYVPCRRRTDVLLERQLQICFISKLQIAEY